MQELLDSHGVPSSRDVERVVIPKAGVAFSAAIVQRVHPKIIQLDIRVQAPLLGDKLLIESFAGIGDDEREAGMNAFEKFSHASFHVLLAVLVEAAAGSNQVDWEIWKNDQHQWRVCLGPMLTQRSRAHDHLHVHDLGFRELLEQLKERLLPRLSPECHWLRTYYMRNDNQTMCSEALLDNVEWPEGRNLIDARTWPDGMYSIRNFLMLVPE
ncbi:MAG TPA: DUF6348 family protein [Terriglobales bacterium]|nr:DUF6348 family protein [Terriglobales bacterium]